MKETKRIALVAHDERKKDLLMWVRRNTETLARHQLFATGTTGRLLADHCGLTSDCMQPVHSRIHHFQPQFQPGL